MLNPYSEQERLNVMLSCCYAAVQTGFRHLPIRFIIDPPHNMFDAALARQIAIHILNVHFDVPRRRIVDMQERQRTSISFAIQAIDRRLECPVFARAYERMAARASDLFMREIRKAAA
jgi:hypothetical protein